MDEIATEVVKTSVEVALRPVTEIAENVLGRLGGDWLAENRRRNREHLRRETDQILEGRGVSPIPEPSPAVIVPLLSAAQDESREELLRLWAQLLAASVDPNRSSSYRREYVEIVQKLEPIDVRCLMLLWTTNGHMAPSKKDFIAQNLGVSPDEIEMSFRNLAKLELTFTAAGGAPAAYPALTTLAKRLMQLAN